MKNIAKTIVLMVLLLVSSSCKSTSNKEFNYDNFDLAIMIEDGSGYKKYEQITWPDPNEYALNTATSTCADGNTMNWDKKTGAIYLTSNKWDKCYAKFDKIIKINKIEDLVDLSKRVNGGDALTGKTVELTTDLDFQNKSDYKAPENKETYQDFNGDGITGKTIYEELTDLNGAGFVPIGIDNKTFRGNFDGNNHTLNNLYVNNITNKRQLGLFGRVNSTGKNNLEIRNLIISGKIISASVGKPIGGFIGEAGGNIICDNLTNKVTINNSDNSGNSNIGGIIGSNNSNVTLVRCKNEGDIIGGTLAGGLIGWNGSNVTINECVNSGNVDCSNGNSGGLIGADASAKTGTQYISNSYNSGEVAAGGFAGGIIFSVSGKISIINTFNVGKILGKRLSGCLIAVVVNNAPYTLEGVENSVCNNLNYVGQH